MLPLPSNVKVSCFVCITNSTCSIFFAIKKLSEKTSFTSKLCVLSQKKLPYVLFSFENKQIGIVLRVYYYAELHIPKKKNQYGKKITKLSTT